MKRKKPSLYFYFLEIRYRLLYCFFSFSITFVTSYFYSFELIFLLVQPFFLPKNFIFTDITEALSTTLNICIISSFHSILPFLIYQFWAFIIPGFFMKERKRINFFLLVIFFLLIFGVFFVFYKILPEIYKFLFTFEIKKEIITIQLEARIYSYINFTFKLYFYIVFFCQIPLVFFLLFENKILITKNLVAYRKYFYFFSFLVAAFISPPDLIAQLTFALFFSIFYEINLWFGFFYERKKIKDL